MNELLILRHAKAEAQASSSSDHKRELSELGRRQAAAMGRLLADRRLIPEMILASDSTRTRQTVDLLVAEWEQAVPVVALSELYGGGPEEYLSAVAANAGNCSRVLVVGHNPTVEELAQIASGRIVTIGTGSLAVAETASLTQLSVDSPMSVVEVLEATP